MDTINNNASIFRGRHIDDDGRLFLDSAKSGDTSGIRDLLSNNKYDAHTINHALKMAAVNGHADTVSALVDCGADVHFDDDMPLRFSAANGHAAVVRKLLRAGANVHALGDQALLLAIGISQSTETVAILLKHGANARAVDKSTGGTALGAAAVRDCRECVNLLLKYGADPGEVDEDTRNWIRRYGQPDVLSRLVPASTKYSLDSDFAVSTEVSFPDSKITLRRIFDFRARQVIIMNASGSMSVQSFDQAGRQMVDDARAAWNNLHKLQSPHQPGVTPSIR
jgi:ankyrin repeat protein